MPIGYREVLIFIMDTAMEDMIITDVLSIIINQTIVHMDMHILTIPIPITEREDIIALPILITTLREKEIGLIVSIEILDKLPPLLPDKKRTK
jgi:hypothetical protein